MFSDCVAFIQNIQILASIPDLTKVYWQQGGLIWMLLFIISVSIIMKGQHRGSIRASHPAAPGSILGTPKNFRTEIYWETLLSQWTVSMEQTYLVQSMGLQIQLGYMPS